MGDDIGAFGAVILVSVFWIMVLIFSMAGAYNAGYETAYTDVHKGNIETIAQKKYPALWIKYNVAEPKR
jgi:hypothetical protein